MASLREADQISLDAVAGADVVVFLNDDSFANGVLVDAQIVSRKLGK